MRFLSEAECLLLDASVSSGDGFGERQLADLTGASDPYFHLDGL